MAGFLANLSLAVGRPWWLLALPLVLPPLVLFSLRSLAGLGRFRRAVAILFRATVVTLIVLALAELQMVRRNDKLTTLFLLDVSESIPRDQQGPMVEFVNQAVTRYRRPDDLAGVIVFGKGPRVEAPPTSYPSDLLGIESTVDPEYTDLASAIKLALATFPEDSARRIVILSDGNENRGNALEQALAAQALGVQIDVLPNPYEYDREVLVEKVSVPPDVKKGETVNINVVIRASERTGGTLRVFQRANNYSELASEPVHRVLERGLNVFTLKQTIEQPNFYTYTAQFEPDRDSGDRRAINNVAEGFIHARGEATVLLIEGARGEHEELVRALRDQKVEVTVLASGEIQGGGLVGGDPLPTDMAQFQPYDAVILANVPKDAFTDAQQQLLESIVHDQGIGLLMLGGPNSFGAGGWTDSPVERALPVDMQIKAMKVMGKSALVMIMHASEIAEGNFWQKEIAKEALKTLSPYDYAGMLHWQGQEAWLFTLREIGPNKPGMLAAIDRMFPGDMPDFDPTLQKAVSALRARTDAMTKHIIVISDGDPTPPTPAVIRQLQAARVTVTAVLTAAHGGDLSSLNTMKNLATSTKGRFYNVTNPRALPRIYQKEARLISRPLIFEHQPAWLPVVDHLSEPISGLTSGSVPPISGLVLTSRKENVLVDVPILSPLPVGQENPLLAHWTYGLGRAVAFTSDAGRRWAADWPTWDDYSAFWAQVVRWALRPVDRGNLTLSLRREEGQIKVVVDALDKEDQFLNFLQLQGQVSTPNAGESRGIELTQTAPGRYEGTIENAEARGNYFVTLGYNGPKGARVSVSGGISVPYSDEYRDLKSSPAALQALASVTGGKPLAWKLAADGQLDAPRTVDSGADVFRRDPGIEPPHSFRDLWPNLLWLAAVLFLGDVAVRRIAPDLDRMRRGLADAWQRLRGHEVAPRVEYMEKLRSRKAEVGEQIERSRSATRFEPPPVPPSPIPSTSAPPGETRPSGPPPSASPAAPTLGPDQPRPEPEPESYTNRLLRAKQKVWEDREKDKDKGKP